MRPLVSVIIPTYNLASVLVARSIASVLNQTYRELECLVIDDGSTDDTEQRVRALMQGDERLRYFKIVNGGQSRAKNFGVSQARGELIAFNDHDDEYLPEYVAAAVAMFQTLPPEVAYLSSGVINRDENGRESYYLPQLEPFWKLSIGNGWLFRSAAFHEHHIITDPEISSFEDLDLHLQFRKLYRGYVIDRPLRIYHLRTASSSSALKPHEHHQRFFRSFENFFKLYKRDYESFGRPAISWLYFFGGLAALRAGHRERGREFLRRSWQSQPSFLTGCYLTAAGLGSPFFQLFDRGKNLIMRRLRIYLLNRL